MDRLRHASHAAQPDSPSFGQQQPHSRRTRPAGHGARKPLCGGPQPASGWDSQQQPARRAVGGGRARPRHTARAGGPCDRAEAVAALTAGADAHVRHAAAGRVRRAGRPPARAGHAPVRQLRGFQAGVALASPRRSLRRPPRPRRRTAQAPAGFARGSGSLRGAAGGRRTCAGGRAGQARAGVRARHARLVGRLRRLQELARPLHRRASGQAHQRTLHAAARRPCGAAGSPRGGGRFNGHLCRRGLPAGGRDVLPGRPPLWQLRGPGRAPTRRAHPASNDARGPAAQHSALGHLQARVQRGRDGADAVQRRAVRVGPHPDLRPGRRAAGHRDAQPPYAHVVPIWQLRAAGAAAQAQGLEAGTGHAACRAPHGRRQLRARHPLVRHLLLGTARLPPATPPPLPATPPGHGRGFQSGWRQRLGQGDEGVRAPLVARRHVRRLRLYPCAPVPSASSRWRGARAC
mmetsp:Transcript_10407/g.34472  ORF Transcript_10407/g.34472 Transcript_10407/m.34472 type:complete len:461 (+) Transcript_10407:1803-3185(+)